MSMEDHYYSDDDSDCANCGGTGYVANCYSEYACVAPEEGCDECMRHCYWCNPPKLTPKEQADKDALRQVLADALAKPNSEAQG
jgi:hypothetical protein